jgi:hypothetical protein
MNDDDAIAYFPPNDMACGLNVQNIPDFIKKHKTATTVNQAISFFNIARYIENKIFLTTWTKHFTDTLAANQNTYKSNALKFFGAITSRSLIKNARQTDVFLRKDFLLLLALSKCATRKKISGQAIESAIKQNAISIHDLLKNKYLVDNYRQNIKKIMLSNPGSAEILIRKYVIEIGDNDELFLPIFTQAEIDKLMLKYINFDHAHPDTLNVIYRFNDTNNLRVAPGIRLKAQKAREKMLKKLFNIHSAGHFGYKLDVGVSGEIPEIEGSRVESIDTMSTRLRFSEAWLMNNLDYPTLLNNLVHIMPLVSERIVIILADNPYYHGLTTSFFGVHGIRDYNPDMRFGYMNNLAIMSIRIYHLFLSKHEVRLERVIEWFFAKYLPEEFGITNFSVKLPVKASSFLEKCCSIFPVIDSVLHQYSAIGNDGAVDKSFADMMFSKPFSFTNSRNEHKYFQGNQNSDEFRRAMHILFSTQSRLTYLPKNKQQADNFVDLINENKIYYKLFEKYQKEVIKTAKKLKIVRQDRSGRLYLNYERVTPLTMIYREQAISYYNVDPNVQTSVKKLSKAKWLVESNKLFTDAEIKLFSYYLDNESFDDGVQLRNRYCHGRYSSMKNKEHIYNYYIGLMLLILVVIKINDDLCIENNFGKDSA